MTPIEAIQSGIDALELPCDRWNKEQTLIVQRAIYNLRAAIAGNQGTEMTNELERMYQITKTDHPDFVDGIVWANYELRWINERITLAILAEREACAKVCEARIGTMPKHTYAKQFDGEAQECAEAIRAQP